MRKVKSEPKSADNHYFSRKIREVKWTQRGRKEAERIVVKKSYGRRTYGSRVFPSYSLSNQSIESVTLTHNDHSYTDPSIYF